MPKWNLEIRKRLAGLNLRPDREAEIVEELSDHLQQRYEELRGRGIEHDEAFRDVIAEVDWTDFVPELQISEKTPRLDTVPDTLGLRPFLGRFFLPSEDTTRIGCYRRKRN